VNCKSRHDFPTPIIQIPIKIKKREKTKKRQVEEEEGPTCITDDYVLEEVIVRHCRLDLLSRKKEFYFRIETQSLK
jgi:hypothetical protein